MYLFIQLVVCSDPFEYEGQMSTAYILGFRSDSTEVLTDYEFPSLYQDKTITQISENAFQGSPQLSGYITLPGQLERIQDFAFQRCSRITAVDIPATIQSIGNYAFDSCSSLKTVELHYEGSFLFLYSRCFSNCYLLQTFNYYSTEPPSCLPDIFAYPDFRVTVPNGYNGIYFCEYLVITNSGTGSTSDTGGTTGSTGSTSETGGTTVSTGSASDIGDSTTSTGNNDTDGSVNVAVIVIPIVSVVIIVIIVIIVIFKKRMKTSQKEANNDTLSLSYIHDESQPQQFIPNEKYFQQFIPKEKYIQQTSKSDESIHQLPHIPAESQPQQFILAQDQPQQFIPNEKHFQQTSKSDNKSSSSSDDIELFEEDPTKLG